MAEYTTETYPRARKTASLSFAVTEEDRERLIAIAAKHGVGPSTMARILLLDAMRREESTWQKQKSSEKPTTET
jgi:pantothenate kinase